MVVLTRLLRTAAKKEYTDFQKMFWNLSGFNKYGLYSDDIIGEEDENVVEAVRRLPQHIKDERNFRIIRALHLNMCHIYLPKDQWLKIDDNVSYLQPYLQEVIAEVKEKNEWNKKV